MRFFSIRFYDFATFVASCVVSLACIGVCESTFAQTTAIQPDTVNAASRQDAIDNERSKIALNRSQIVAKFQGEQVACYKRFAVNSCLDDVSKRQREVLDVLRRQDLSLNDEERKLRGLEEVRKTEEKVSPAKQQEAAENRAKAIQDSQSRLIGNQQKQTDRATAKGAEASNIEATANRLKANQEKAKARLQEQSGAADRAKEFNQRQKEALERRTAHDADQAARTKPPSNPLPAP